MASREEYTVTASRFVEGAFRKRSWAGAFVAVLLLCGLGYFLLRETPDLVGTAAGGGGELVVALREDESNAGGQISASRAAVESSNSARDDAPRIKRVVRTTDLDGGLLSGVALAAKAGDVALQEGVSDSQGCWTVSQSATGPLEVKAKFLGRFEASVTAPAGTDEVVVVIDTGGAVRGRVVLPDGKPAPAGTRVLAWPMDSPLAARVIAESALLGDFESQAGTAIDGAFVIRGLDRTKTYSVTAGGKGLMRKQPFNSIVPDGKDLLLELFPVYGAVVRLIDASSGGPVRVASTFWPMGSVSTRVADTSLIHFVPGGAGSTLAGLTSDWFDRESAGFTHITLCAAPGGGPALGPFVLHASLPGYRAVEAEFVASPVFEGLQVVDVLMEPIADAWGEVRVEFSGKLAAASLEPRTPLSWAKLHLRDAHGKILQYALPKPSGDPSSIRPIPAGPYDARVVILDGLARPLDWQRIDVGAEPATLTVPVGTLGAIEVHARKRDGSPYSGRLSLSVQALRGPQTLVAFDDAPYAILGLDAREYSVRVMSPFLSELDGGRVTVLAGEAAVVEFDAP